MLSQAEISEIEKREALENILESQTFARSAKLRAFVRHICEQEIAGHLEELTEYQIAANLLGRSEEFNVTYDSTVRNRAYELRQRLDKFYATERPDAPVRIEIPRGGYIPHYTRPLSRAVAKPHVDLIPEPRLAPVNMSKRIAIWTVSGILIGLLAGAALVAVFGRPHPSAILKEAWGPMAQPGDDMLVCVGSNLFMTVRQHVRPHPWRFAVPEQLYSIYGRTRPLETGIPLYMEPAHLSVPIADLAAATAICNMRATFGGSYQILPESEAPIAALRDRNSVLIGSSHNSVAASILTKSLALSVDYGSNDSYAIIDHRKPAGQNQIYQAYPGGADERPSVLYGLLTVITSRNSLGELRRTLVISGTGSAGDQAAVEFFCSPDHMRELKGRFRAAGFSGFPPIYQVIIRCRTAGLRLLSYEYVSHAVVQATR